MHIERLKRLRVHILQADQRRSSLLLLIAGRLLVYFAFNRLFSLTQRVRGRNPGSGVVFGYVWLRLGFVGHKRVLQRIANYTPGKGCNNYASEKGVCKAEFCNGFAMLNSKLY